MMAPEFWLCQLYQLGLHHKPLCLKWHGDLESTKHAHKNVLNVRSEKTCAAGDCFCQWFTTAVFVLAEMAEANDLGLVT